MENSKRQTQHASFVLIDTYTFSTNILYACMLRAQAHPITPHFTIGLKVYNGWRAVRHVGPCLFPCSLLLQHSLLYPPPIVPPRMSRVYCVLEKQPNRVPSCRYTHRCPAQHSFWKRRRAKSSPIYSPRV